MITEQQIQGAVMSEWIKWDGGECPVPPETEVQIKFYDDVPVLNSCVANEYDWKHRGDECDIVAYRVIKEAPQGHPHAALIAEYAEIAKTNPRPWEEFEVSINSKQEWTQCICNPCWDMDRKYRRKPKKKKVRMYQWIRKFDFYYIDTQLYPEGTTPSDAIQRIEPGFEIEVEE